MVVATVTSHCYLSPLSLCSPFAVVSIIVLENVFECVKDYMCIFTYK